MKAILREAPLLLTYNPIYPSLSSTRELLGLEVLFRERGEHFQIKHHAYSRIGLDKRLSSDIPSTLIICKRLLWASNYIHEHGATQGEYLDTQGYMREQQIRIQVGAF